MPHRLDQQVEQFHAALAEVNTEEALYELQVAYLGKKGSITLLKAEMGKIPPAERKAFGAAWNRVRDEIEAALERRRDFIKGEARRRDLERQVDLTMPPLRPPPGSLHPLTQTRRRLSETFIRLGFDVAVGPHVEGERFNFDDLNVPKDHPTRDMQDTFFIRPPQVHGLAPDGPAAQELVLRTHTSPVQIRTMRTRKPPIRIVAPGATFRCDDDATHSPMFHQIEGLYVDEGVTLADLKATLMAFTEDFFGHRLEVRFRPSFFPFVEPGAEFDLGCPFCRGSGCNLCKGTGFIEIGGCGMVHPKVLSACGIDPEIYTGWAFGFGIDRMTMMLHQIPHLRLMFEGDIRFLEQFPVLISYTWLTDLLDLPGPLPTPAELAKILTGLGLEVEAVHARGAGLETILVGEIRGKTPHPQASKLTVVELFDGRQTLCVVCGASNLPAIGGKVAFAPIGARLPDGLEIAARELRGVASQGMICSETELDIGADGDGILILPESSPTGAPLHTQLPGMIDHILELGVTPNRPDALGHVGVARDVAAKLGGSLRLPAMRTSVAPQHPTLVTIAAPDRCGRYLGYGLIDVKVGPSPLWLRVRLHRLGLRSISNVVDITNFVLFEFGQPLHAFDRSKLAEGRVVVRMAHREEALRTLDASDRVLDGHDLVIADATHAQALAGVMGGAGSMVDAGTTEVLLEAAWFAPPGIRASARRHGLATDASHRFERGVDHGLGLEGAALRALNLLEDLAGGRCVVRAEALGERPARPTITLRPARVEQLLGVAVPAQEMRTIFHGIEVEVDEHEPGAWRCLAPTHRPDLQIEVDLIEEIMRHHGLEHVPARASVPREARPAAAPDAMTARIDRLADGLREAGLHEIVSLAFVAEDKLRHFEQAVPEARYVRVANPMRGAGVMRTHLLPGLLDALAHNVVRHGRAVRLFEIGRVYAWPRGQVHPERFAAGTRDVDVQLPEERTVAGLLLHTSGKGGPDPRALSGAVAQALGRFGFTLQLSQGPGVSWLHPGVQARLGVGASAITGEAVEVGVFGELHPDLVAAWGLPEGSRPVYAELDLAALPDPDVALAREIPRIPATSRDLSLEIPLSLPAAEVVLALRAGGVAQRLTGEDPPRLYGAGAEGGVEVLEDYRGAGVPAGHRALLLRLHYAAHSRSVTDAEVQALHAAIVEHACVSLRRVAASVRPR